MLTPGQRFCLYGFKKAPRGRGYVQTISVREKLADGSRPLEMYNGRFYYRTQKAAAAHSLRLNHSSAVKTCDPHI
jgi:hypothetical protein